MFILFDSNVWFSDLGLQSKHGAAVRHFARRRGATVAIPEIVELEVEERLAASLIQSRQKIVKNHRRLLPVLGKLQKLHLPSEESIREAVTNIIPDFDIPTRRIPFSEDVARSSMLKVLRRIPPSAKTEQFRDGVIWAHCLDLLAEGVVYLVSRDQDFYKQKDYAQGLAPELVKEMEEKSQTQEIKLIPCLTELLEDIHIPVETDTDRIFKSVVASCKEDLKKLLAVNGFELFGRVEGKADYFATEEARNVWVKFSFSHPCQDVTGADRDTGTLILEGSGFLDSETENLYEVQTPHIRLDYPDWEPSGPMRGIVSVSARMNASEVHQVRFPL